MSKFENKIAQVDELKKQIDEKRPLTEHQSKLLREHYRIGLTYSSNAIEGNTLTEVETKIVIEEGLTIGGKPVRDHQEAIGHSHAYDFLYELVDKDGVSEEDILKFHRLFYETVDADQAGKYRSEPVLVTGIDIEFPKPQEVSQLMKELANELPELNKKHHPVEFAAIAHNKLVTVHPFIDGNGRAARLMMNLILMQKGYVITIVPPVYRTDYLQCAYEGNKGNHMPFIQFLSCCVYESEKEYVKLLTSLQ